MWYLKDYHIHLGIFLLNLNYNLFWILFAFTYDMVNFWKFSLRISWYRENITFQPLFSPHCDHHGEKKQPMPTAQLPLCCSRLCYRWLFLQNLARKKPFFKESSLDCCVDCIQAALFPSSFTTVTYLLLPACDHAQLNLWQEIKLR
jgi:hypothetical protein